MTRARADMPSLIDERAKRSGAAVLAGDRATRNER